MRLGVAIEGGGTRCAAALGVLKALEENGVEPYAYCGCGAGAAVAAMGACGVPPGSRHCGISRVRAVWAGAHACTFSRVGSMLWQWGHLRARPASRSNGRLGDGNAARIRLHVARCRPDPHPWSRQAELVRAVLAAMALPGAIAPVLIRERALVGGGMLRYALPQLLRAMGADTVLCVRTVGFAGACSEKKAAHKPCAPQRFFSPAPTGIDIMLSLENKLDGYGVLETAAMRPAAAYRARGCTHRASGAGTVKCKAKRTHCALSRRTRYKT